jgi:very-short-patch-repair endonuclease
LYTLRGVLEAPLTRLWLATLAPGAGAVVSHEAAAALHGMATFSTGPVTVTVPHATSRIDHLATVHQSRRLYPEHITLIDGLRVTTVARTAIDLAAIYRRARMEIVVDDSLTSWKVKLPELCATFDDLASRGRKGVRLMRAILEDRQPGYIAPQSRAESLMLRVLRHGGLPRPVLQFPHPSPAIDSHVDGAYVSERILIEIDSRRWHTKVRDIDRDHERDQAANLVDWDTYRFSWADLTKRPAWVVSQLREARRQAA